jgi:hypothetical protein
MCEHAVVEALAGREFANFPSEHERGAAHMSWDVFVFDLPPGIKSISEIPPGWSPPPLGKRADIIEKICALYPEANFGDPSWGRLRLPGVSIEFSFCEDAEINHFAMHVRGGDPAPHVVAHILGELGMRAVCSGSDSGLFEYDPVSGSKAFDSWRGYASYVSSRTNGGS